MVRDSHRQRFPVFSADPGKVHARPPLPAYVPLHFYFHRFTSLCLTIFLLLALGLTSPAAAYELLVSNSSQRGAPQPLHATQLTALVHIYGDTGDEMDRVLFHLDNPTTAGKQACVERNPPHDFMVGNQHRNFSFDVGTVHFVLLMAARNFNGIEARTLAPLKANLEAARARDTHWLIPYLHFAPFSEGKNHPSNPALRVQLAPHCQGMGVKRALAAHDQSYERTFPLVCVPTANTPTSTHLRCSAHRTASRG